VYDNAQLVVIILIIFSHFKNCNKTKAVETE